MKTIMAIANYGVLAHEKETVYTFGGNHHHADFSEEVKIDIPDEFRLSRNHLEEYLIDVPTGETFLLSEILGFKGGCPVIHWQSRNEYHTVPLESREV